MKIEGWHELEHKPEGLPEAARAKVWVANVPKDLGRFHTLYDGDRRLPIVILSRLAEQLASEGKDVWAMEAFRQREEMPISI